MGISLGLVGLGSFGKAFAPLYKNHPLVDRIALCDRNPDAIREIAEDPFYADKLNPRDIYNSLDEILKTDLDALVIITQPWLHAPQCIAALESGKHVYSAVPVISIPDYSEIMDWCDRLIRTCEQTGLHYMLGETTVFRPKSMFCRRMADENKFGDFVHAEGEYCHDLDNSCNLRDVRSRRINNPGGEEWLNIIKKAKEKGVKSNDIGPMHYPTHSVSGPVHVMRSHAVKACAIGYKNCSEDEFFADSDFSNVTAFYKMDNGASFRVCEFRESPGFPGDDGETFRIAGTAGTFSNGNWHFNGRFDGKRVPPVEPQKLTDREMRDPLPEDVENAFKQVQFKGNKEIDIANADFTPTGHGGSHPYLVHEFVTAVAENRQPLVNAWEAVHYMAMGAAAHESAIKDGEWVNVTDWGYAPA